MVLLAVAALGFQVFHLAEHTAQMVMWLRFPDRAPWMSPWAHEATLWLGGIDLGRASETTLASVRGMELLHLLGNAVFLVGAVALLQLTAPGTRARSWAQAGVIVQGLHTLEHVALTASLFAVGRPIGLSTGLGAFDGTRLSTSRVWWHGSINLLATAICAVAVVAVVGSVRRREVWLPSPRRMVPATTFAVVTLPAVLALLVGSPIEVAATRPTTVSLTDESQLASMQLVDVAAEVGLDVRHSAFRWDVTPDPVAMMGGGVCWIDVDRDGWLDLFVTDTWADGEWGLWNGGGELPTSRLLRNVGGRFEDVSDEWGAAHATRANGCVAADFDGDGFTDLYVTTSRANLLLWNEGGTAFVERGAEAGVDTYGWHTGAAAGDLDGDGLVDLVVAGYADLNRRRTDASTGFPNTFEPIDDVVLLNQGDRTFRPVTQGSGIEPDGPEYGLGVVLVDLDVDGDLDVHVANDTQPNRVYLNESSPGAVRLVDVSAASGADDPNSGMGIGTGDLNADGRPDLVVTNLAGQGHASLASSGVDGGAPVFAPDFEEVRSLGLAATGWGASFGDLDLDGDLDLLVASGAIPIESLGSAAEPLVYFCNTEAGLVESTADVGLGALEERNGRGIALADYDNDGDLDAAVSAIGEPLALLENRGARGNWVSVDAGVPVPGLRVRAELTDGVTIERIAAVGGSWLSSEDPRIHLGLGDADGVELLTVTWPDGTIDQVRDVEAGQVVLVG